VVAVVRCPYCGFEGEFRLLKTWKYRMWDVYYYECPKCSGRFRWQVDPSGRFESYIIRVGKRRGGSGRSLTTPVNRCPRL